MERFFLKLYFYIRKDLQLEIIHHKEVYEKISSSHVIVSGSKVPVSRNNIQQLKRTFLSLLKKTLVVRIQKYAIRHL